MDPFRRDAVKEAFIIALEKLLVQGDAKLHNENTNTVNYGQAFSNLSEEEIFEIHVVVSSASSELLSAHVEKATRSTRTTFVS